MLHGTLPSTAAVGGRYDPSWSSETDADDDDDDDADYRFLIDGFNKRRNLYISKLI